MTDKNNNKAEIPPSFMKSTFLRALAALAAASMCSIPANAQTATTDPVGFSQVSLSVGTSLVVPTLDATTAFTGMAVISADGTTITPTIAPNWVAGMFAKTAFTAPTLNFPKFYAEIIFGPQEGLVIDIDTNSATALTTFANEITAASGLRGTTVQIAVRQHVTVDKVIAGATGLSPYQDSISVFTSDGMRVTCNYNGSSFVDRNFTLPVGHTVIYPGTGFIITVNAPVTLSLLGSVKTTKTQIPLFVGTTNIVGPLEPASPSLFYGNTALATALLPYQDGINYPSTDGNMRAASYSSNGTSILDRNFNPLPSTATDAVAPNRGMIITVNSDTVWVAKSPLTP